MEQEIRIIVPRDHRKPTQVSVNGVKGESCKGLTAGIEAALGSVTTDVETEEFYERPAESHLHIRQQQG